MWFSSETFPVTFRRRATIVDPTGGTTRGDYSDFISLQANVRQVTGREIAEGGRSIDSIDCIIRIRDNSRARSISASDRAKLRGQDFEIVTVGIPNRRDGYIEMTLRRQEGAT